jgi:hypothetical protein
MVTSLSSTKAVPAITASRDAQPGRRDGAPAVTIDDAVLHLVRRYGLTFPTQFSVRVIERRRQTYSLCRDAFARFLRRAFLGACDRFLEQLPFARFAPFLTRMGAGERGTTTGILA